MKLSKKQMHKEKREPVNLEYIDTDWWKLLRYFDVCIHVNSLFLF